MIVLTLQDQTCCESLGKALSCSEVNFSDLVEMLKENKKQKEQVLTFIKVIYLSCN